MAYRNDGRSDWPYGVDFGVDGGDAPGVVNRGFPSPFEAEAFILGFLTGFDAASGVSGRRVTEAGRDVEI